MITPEKHRKRAREESKRREFRNPAMPEQNTFLSEVEEERIKKGWSKRRMSIESYGNVSSYFEYTSGKRNATVLALKAMAEALDMKLVICLMEKEE